MMRIADRGWIALRRGSVANAVSGLDGVVACSALKRRYRDHLREADETLRFVFLDIPEPVLRRRLAQRHHFMPPQLLQSQLQALERP